MPIRLASKPTLLTLACLLAAPALALASPPGDPAFYQSKQSYAVEGTVVDVESDELTLMREGGLPKIELEVSKAHTKITLDGKTASVMDLRPGTQVRGQFQIHGDDIVALSLDGKSAAAGTNGGK